MIGIDAGLFSNLLYWHKRSKMKKQVHVMNLLVLLKFAVYGLVYSTVKTGRLKSIGLLPLWNIILSAV